MALLPELTYKEQKKESSYADLVDAEFADFYNAVGRDEFIRIVNENNNNRNAIRQIFESQSNNVNFESHEKCNTEKACIQ